MNKTDFLSSLRAELTAREYPEETFASYMEQMERFFSAISDQDFEKKFVNNEKEIEKMGEDLDRGQNTQQSKTAVDETRRSKEVLPKFVKENRKIWIVYKYVARHPHCKATEIKKKIGGCLYDTTTSNK